MRWFPVAVLAYAAVTNFFRGAVHSFAPDGGAHSIAGLDLTTNAPTILSLFAALGLQQLVMGFFQIYVLLRRRDLVPLALGLQTALTAAGVANLFFWRRLPVHVPGEVFNAALLVLLAAAVVAAVTQGRKALNS
jgi:hypothetical protein